MSVRTIVIYFLRKEMKTPKRMTVINMFAPATNVFERMYCRAIGFI